MPNQPLCLVSGCDDNVVAALAVTLFSALSRLDPAQDVTLSLLDGGISAEHKQRIERVVGAVRPDASLAWIAPDPAAMQGLGGTVHLPVAAYLRLFVPGLLPLEIARALYLDCDVLVKGDLAELWKTDLAGASIGAVRDFGCPDVSHFFSGVKDYLALGLSAETPYFNSGILLMDLARWRTQGVADHALAYARRHDGILENCDQDALNATLSHDWQPLDYRWNVQHSLCYLHKLPATAFAEELLPMRPALLKDAKIIHFTGTPKPWNHWCGHPATDEWARTLLASGWFTPAEARKWALGYGAKRTLFKLKVALRLYPQYGYVWQAPS